MANGSHVRLFISCVSAEFRAYREALRKGLVRHNVTVQIQEDFIAGGVPTLDKLNTYIAGCDAVIHLAGDMTGAMANPHSLEAIKALCPDLATRLPPLKNAIETGSPELSYTQWEAYLAIYHRKTLVIAEPFDTAPREKTYKNDAAQVAARKTHLDRLAALNRHAEINFATADKLVNGVLSALVDILRPAIPKPINLPYPSLGTLFKGREEFMADLRESLDRADGKRAAAIYNAVHGLGGVGKTRLAVEYAWQHEADYTALLFAVAEARVEETKIAPGTPMAAQSSPLELRRNLGALAGPLILNLPEQEIPDEEQRVIAVVRWLQANPNWLLIIDNVDTEESTKEVQKYLPQLRNGHVLITSRRSSWPRHIERKELGVLPAQAAEAFLLDATASSRQIASDDVAQARTIAKELGHLALALEQAAAYTERHHLSFGEYLKAWREKHDTVASWYDPQTMTYPMSVAVTWQTSVARLKPEARKLLNRLAFLSPEPVPAFLLDVITSTTAADDQRAALLELNSYSFVTWARGASTFTVHRLVQDVTRRTLDEKEYAVVLEEALWWISTAFDLDPFDTQNWSKLDAIAPHAQAVADQADAVKILNPTAWLSSRLGDLLRPRLPLREVGQLYRRALALTIKDLESDPESTSIQRELSVAYSKIGDILDAQGDITEALAHYRKDIEICEHLTKTDSENLDWQHDLSVSYDRVGNVLFAQGNHAKAFASYHDGLMIRERLATAAPTNGRWQRDLSVSHEKLGDALLADGKITEAFTSFNNSLAIRKRLAEAAPSNAGRKRDLSVTYYKLGRALAAQGNVTEALTSFRENLTIGECLIEADPGNVEWQLDVIWSHWELAQNGDDPARRLRVIVDRLHKLKAEGKLTAEQTRLLLNAEGELAKVEKTKKAKKTKKGT